jgi:hypothetical protein
VPSDQLVLFPAFSAAWDGTLQEAALSLRAVLVARCAESHTKAPAVVGQQPRAATVFAGYFHALTLTPGFRTDGIAIAI